MAPVHHYNKADNTLTINDAQMSDNGSYSCMGKRNGRPSISHISSHIHVFITGESLSQLGTSAVNEGSITVTGLLTCVGKNV